MLRMIAIEAVDLVKTFKDTNAVNGVSFKVAPGETLGLLGGNGAGKTTTIAMLLGLISPTSGIARVLGADIAKDPYAIRHRINFQSPYVALPRRLSVRENLRTYSALYEVAKPKERIAELAEALEMTDFMDRPTGSLSAGQMTRVGLAKSLINRPEVLFLDEPTASLDPDTADWVRTLLETYQRDTGCAILLASHNMNEVVRLAHRVVMMKKGAIVDEGTPQALLDKYGRDNLEDVFLDIARNRGRAAGQDEVAI